MSNFAHIPVQNYAPNTRLHSRSEMKLANACEEDRRGRANHSKHLPIAIFNKSNPPASQFRESGHPYAAILAADSAKLTIVCFSCESTSSAMVITSVKRRLKSTALRLVCRVLNMLTCNIRDSSIIIGIE